MEAKTTKQCPQEVKRQLLAWQKCGWIEVQLPEDELAEQQTIHQVKDNKDLELSIEDERELPIEEQWCERLKTIAKQMSSTLNETKISTNARGYSGCYTFSFYSEGFCNMMDELLRDYRSDITSYLHNTKKPTGVTLVLPFLGEIIREHIFNKKELQKTDLADIFKKIGYNGDVAVKKLSMHSKLDINPDTRLLLEKAKMLGKKYAKH